MNPRSPAIFALATALALAACRGTGALDVRAQRDVPLTPGAALADDSGAPLGSTRDSVVALDTAGGAREVRFLAADPALARTPGLPANLTIVAGLGADEVLERAAEFHGMDARFATPEVLRAAENLRWVQAMSAGVDRYLDTPELVEADVVLTNMRGVHGPAIADHAMAMLLSLTRRLDAWRAAMGEGRWDRRRGEDMTALAGKTMLVVGLGGIGTEVARRADGFGMRVWATRRSATPPPPFVDRQELAGALDELLPEADVVVICLPLTDETEGLFDAARIARMKPGSFLVNIARGRICDTDAIVRALDAGHLAGAGLDVTDPEPLPEGHPLWSREDAIVTPHVAWRAEVTGERRDLLLAENLRRFAAGEPLLNVVDKRAGY